MSDTKMIEVFEKWAAEHGYSIVKTPCTPNPYDNPETLVRFHTWRAAWEAKPVDYGFKFGIADMVQYTASPDSKTAYCVEALSFQVRGMEVNRLCQVRSIRRDGVISTEAYWVPEAMLVKVEPRPHFEVSIEPTLTTRQAAKLVCGRCREVGRPQRHASGEWYHPGALVCVARPIWENAYQASKPPAKGDDE